MSATRPRAAIVRVFFAAFSLGIIGVFGTGCSVDAMLWGSDGAQVIETTERIIEAASKGDVDTYVCADNAPELRDPEDWKGLSPEEPGRFTPEYWPEQASLDPSWSINLSLPADRVNPGEEYPGDVFYRNTDSGLCLVAVAWWTVEE